MAKKGWEKHNQDVFKKALAEHRNALEKRLTNVFHELAEAVKAYIESLAGIPVFTGNLADSTGLGVYYNGMLKEFMPTQRANMPQTYQGEIVWGNSLLEMALADAAYKYNKGIWVVLFSTVPYAVRVDKNGTTRFAEGYFSNDLVPDMLNQFKLAFAREFPNIKLTV